MKKYVFLGIMLMLLSTVFAIHKTSHPYYVSVTEIEYNAKEKELGIACKLFTDDFEFTLKDQFNQPINIYKPADTAKLNNLVEAYITKHLMLNIDGNRLKMLYLGYEIEGEAIWCYFSVPGVPAFKQLNVFNDLLYTYKKEQINMIHVRVNGEKQSHRLTHPNTTVSFEFKQ